MRLSVDLTSKATNMILKEEKKRRSETKKTKKRKGKAQLPRLSTLGIARLGKRTGDNLEVFIFSAAIIVIVIVIR
jgi:hypothetical protein